MNTRDNTILITGGATGIGFALAKAFLNAGNEVIICGRRENRLIEAKNKCPGLHIKPCDVSEDKDRRGLFHWVESNFNNINVLVNNAGMQRMIDLKCGARDLISHDSEIETNLAAPIYLSAYFIPALLKRKESAIINISSGLGFVPMAVMPVYCATKAALHSYTLSLRHQLKNTPIKVFEIIPPIVDTELDRGAREARGGGQKNRGIQAEEVAEATMKALGEDKLETAIGMAQNLVAGSRTNPEQVFLNMNQ